MVYLSLTKATKYSYNPINEKNNYIRGNGDKNDTEKKRNK